MRKLYIIGNGFDLNFNLPTKTCNFIEELKKIRFDTYNSAWDVYLNYGVDWSCFEETLANIDLEQIEEEVISYPDYLSDHEYDRDAVIWNVNKHIDELVRAREVAFRNMISKAENKIGEIGCVSCADFFDDDEIISFNYTSTIESLFNYKKSVFHIHGFFEDDEQLIFGFGKESDGYYKYRSKLNSEKNAELQKEIQKIKASKLIEQTEKDKMIDEVQSCYDQEWTDPYVDREYEAIISFYEANKKDFQYDRLRDYLSKLSEIDEVVVLGHSMADVDKMYFEEIEEVIHPTKWVISIFKRKDQSEMFSKLKTYSFNSKAMIETMDNILNGTSLK